jgi:recombinational DNA repair protein RecR
MIVRPLRKQQMPDAPGGIIIATAATTEGTTTATSAVIERTIATSQESSVEISTDAGITTTAPGVVMVISGGALKAVEV